MRKGRGPTASRLPMMSHLVILCSQGFLRDVQLDAALLFRGELHQDVWIVGLALSDGRVQGDDQQSVGCVGLGQHKQAHDGIVLDPVVLSLSPSHTSVSPRLWTVDDLTSPYQLTHVASLITDVKLLPLTGRQTIT